MNIESRTHILHSPHATEDGKQVGQSAAMQVNAFARHDCVAVAGLRRGRCVDISVVVRGKTQRIVIPEYSQQVWNDRQQAPSRQAHNGELDENGGLSGSKHWWPLESLNVQPDMSVQL
jgi:hypothetical protein